ncbi:MAG TPA: DsbA family protein [Thermoleophilaceae bacterium]|nr:DsbA family protein [Thermoleophilaceae bacterium]
MTPSATFYLDVGSPFAYLAAERIDTLFPADAVDWQPVSLGALFKANGRSSWALAGPKRRRDGMAEVERRAAERGLPPVRWPDPWPGNYLMAMRAATYADQLGRGRDFLVQALRDGFRHGRDLSIAAHVLESAEQIGLDPLDVERATADPDVKLALRDATAAAHELGVFGVPTVAVAGDLFWGDDRLEDAARA